MAYGVVIRRAKAFVFLSMMDFTISVAMCTFNGSRFLRSQLESIARQSRPPRELVICDDRSSDNTSEIVRDFSRDTGFPVRLEVNTENIGSTKNFEQAIRLCRGHIVALADQDDVWYPNKLERLEQAFLRDGTAAVFSDADLIDEESNSLACRLWPTVGFNRLEQKAFRKNGALAILIKHPVVTGACMAFRRDLFDRMTPFPAEEIHDQWMSFLLATQGHIEIIADPLLQYRRHSQQQVGPGPLKLQGQMSSAKSRGKQFYVNEIERFRRLQRKLGESSAHFQNSESVSQEIRRKLVHLERRAYLPTRRMARVPRILHEISDGSYWRYSGGWISVVKDLIVRT